MTDPGPTLRAIRLWIGLFMVGLVLSGATALPLLPEVKLLASWVGVDETQPTTGLSGLQLWVAKVRDGLAEAYAKHPFLAYGTDWLAFGHFMIAIFFIGALRDPVKNQWVIQAGLVACVLVIPWALVWGAVRGIPFYWRLIDCSFGVIGFVPLWVALTLTNKLSRDPCHGRG